MTRDGFMSIGHEARALKATFDSNSSRRKIRDSGVLKLSGPRDSGDLTHWVVATPPR